MTCWIGSLALIGTPFFSGFYSKDAIIEAVGASHRFGAATPTGACCCGVFVTALYTFRMMFMTFHGPERFRDARRCAGAARAHAEPTVRLDDPHESPWVVTLPLVALAIPSVLIGCADGRPVLFGGYFGDSILVLPAATTWSASSARSARRRCGVRAAAASVAPPFWLALAGVVTAWVFFLKRPQLARCRARSACGAVLRCWSTSTTSTGSTRTSLAPLTRGIGIALWRGGDQALIDGVAGQRHGGRGRLARRRDCGCCRAATSTPMRSG